MNVARTLVSLYPRPFKEHWGAALEGDARAAGWRSWPNVLVSLLDMWIHPAIWPAASRTQRRLRAANLAVAVTAVGWLVGHAVVEMSTSVPRALAHSWILSACDGLTFLGFALVLPFPHLTRRALTELVDRAARLLAVPVFLGGFVVVMVHSGIDPDALPLLRPAVLACWWIALTLGTIQSVRTVAGMDIATITTPGPERLRLGLWTAAAGLALGGSIILGSAVTVGHDRLAGIVAGVGLLALAAATIGTVRDLAATD